MKIIPQIIYLDENNYKIFENCVVANQYMTENNQWKIRELWYICAPQWILDKVKHCFDQVRLFKKEFVVCNNSEEFYNWLGTSELISVVLHYPGLITVDDINPIENGIQYFNLHQLDCGSYVTINKCEIKHLNILYLDNKESINLLLVNRVNPPQIFTSNILKQLKYDWYCVNNISELGKDAEHYET